MPLCETVLIKSLGGHALAPKHVVGHSSGMKAPLVIEINGLQQRSTSGGDADIAMLAIFVTRIHLNPSQPAGKHNRTRMEPAANPPEPAAELGTCPDLTRIQQDPPREPAKGLRGFQKLAMEPATFGRKL